MVDGTLEVKGKLDPGSFWKFGYSQKWCYVDLKYSQICDVAASSKK